jgi:archaellin
VISREREEDRVLRAWVSTGTGVRQTGRREGYEQGFTGLESGIMLIAFTVVASVFIYTVVSAGIFSQARGTEGVDSGLEEMRSTLELTGSVVGYANEVQISTCDGGGWTSGDVANVTLSQDSSHVREGKCSAKASVTSGHDGTDVLAYEDLAEGVDDINLTTANRVRLWYRVSEDPGVSLRLLLDDTNGCLSPIGDYCFAATGSMPAYEWQLVEIDISANASDMGEIVSVGVRVSGNPSNPFTLWLDDIEIVPCLGRVEFAIENTIEEQAIDLTPPYEIRRSQHNELGRTEFEDKAVVTFHDARQYLRECAWTIDWLGEHSEDYLLEDGERAVVSVWLLDCDWDSATGSSGMLDYRLGSGTADGFIDSLENLVGTDHTFTLELRCEAGGTLTIERTTPVHIESIMNLDDQDLVGVGKSAKGS